MPSNYPGNAGNASAHGAPTIACPVDGDPRNAASVNTPLEYLADFVAYLQANAALKGVIETAVFNGAANGAPGDLVAALTTSAVPNTRKLVWAIGAGTLIRLYALPDGTFEITTNAAWDGAQWVRDGGGVITASRLRITNGGVVVGFVLSSATWADSAWVSQAPAPAVLTLWHASVGIGAAAAMDPAAYGMPVPFRGRLRNLRVASNGTVPAGDVVFTVRKNGVDQTLVATIPSGQSVGSDTTHYVDVEAGDLIGVYLDNAANSNAAALNTALLQFDALS